MGMRSTLSAILNFLDQPRLVELGLGALGQIVMRVELNQAFFFDAQGMDMLHSVYARYADTASVMTQAIQLVRRVCASADLRGNFRSEPEAAHIIAAITQFPENISINKDAEWILRILALSREDRDRMHAIPGFEEAMAQ